MSFYSTFGHKVPPDAGVHFYSAMKFALRAVTEGIRLELRNMKSGVKITVSTIASYSSVIGYQIFAHCRKFLQGLCILR